MTRTGFAHQALCYGSDEEFLDGTLGYVDDGVAAGDAVLAVVDRANISLLKDALGNVARAVDFVDSADWYHFPSRTLGRYHAYCTEHEEGGARRVRVIGEPVWTGRTAFETREWMRYESLLNVAFADSGHWIVCPYDTRALPADVVAAARRTHPALAVGLDEETPSGQYTNPAAFYAECDTLQDELTEAPAAPPGPAREVRFHRGRSVAARLAAAEFARHCEVAEDRARDLVAAVHEAVVNAIRFGGGQGVLRMWSDPDWVVCEVTDTGARQPDTSPPGTGFPGHLPPGPRAGTGHGMWVVRQLSDLVTERFGAEGSVVRMHFRR